MSGNIFYRFDPLMICLVLMGVLLVAKEFGFHYGNFRTHKGSGNGRNHCTTGASEIYGQGLRIILSRKFTEGQLLI